MSIRPSVRFDVFKRDDFTCSYCGRRPPVVTLEVDHIIPRVEGGSDERENLTTSCFDCNRGKGGVPLDATPRGLADDIEARAASIRERELQLRLLHQAQAERRARLDEQFDMVWDHWFAIWGAETLPHYYVPWESTLRSYIDSLGPDEVMDAMDVARGRFRNLTTNAVRYFVGVCRRKLSDLEGDAT